MFPVYSGNDANSAYSSALKQPYKKGMAEALDYLDQIIQNEKIPLDKMDHEVAIKMERYLVGKNNNPSIVLKQQEDPGKCRASKGNGRDRFIFIADLVDERIHNIWRNHDTGNNLIPA